VSHANELKGKPKFSNVSESDESSSSKKKKKKSEKDE
jgi:hypothetical protein